MKNIEKILGYEVSSRGLAADVDLALSFLNNDGNSCYMACANPHSIIVASKDPDFEAALKCADILLPDGIGILLAAKLLGKDIHERVAGNEFFIEMNKRTKGKRVKYYFLGSTDRVLSLIMEKMSREYPHIEIVGVYSPPFKDSFSEEENLNMVSTINKAKPDVLWVGMTAPKQEKWISENREKLQVPFVGAIGAVFDFYAGTRDRAPKWICDIGLE